MDRRQSKMKVKKLWPVLAGILGVVAAFLVLRKRRD